VAVAADENHNGLAQSLRWILRRYSIVRDVVAGLQRSNVQSPQSFQEVGRRRLR
jgi:energy-converting hydrogenase A subunit M